MAITATDIQGVSKIADLTDQQVAHIQKEVLYQVQAEEFFSKFTDHKIWKRGSDTLKYRKLIYPKVDPATIKPTAEGVAPKPTALEYGTFQVKVANYRDRVNYTRELVEYSIDDVVSDAASTLSNIAIEKRDYIIGKPFISSKAILTADTSIIATMRKAKIQLGKNKAKKWENGKYLMLASPEDIALLESELEAKGNALDEVTKTEIANCDVKSKYGFEIVECPSDLLYNSNGTDHYIVFLGKNAQGKPPVSDYKLEEIELIHNPLGTGVLIDEANHVTNDANKQLGSVALNLEGLAAAVNDDLCVLVCSFKTTTINDSGAKPALSARTGYVSTSKSPK